MYSALLSVKHTEAAPTTQNRINNEKSRRQVTSSMSMRILTDLQCPLAELCGSYQCENQTHLPDKLYHPPLRML